jgi:hypothetical protein
VCDFPAEKGKNLMQYHMACPEGKWKYIGEALEGLCHGIGKCTWSTGDVYAGQFRHDKMHGQGRMTWSNGTTYDGHWRDAKRSGKGTLTYANGDTFVGEWGGNFRCGYGILTVKTSGHITRGMWNNDAFCFDFPASVYSTIRQ